MKTAGNKIELKIFPGGKHGLFYDNEEGVKFWKDTVREFVKKL